MIDISRINTTFKQEGDSCVLASYAIVFNYFTGLEIGKAFEAYCQHFNLTFSNWKDAEREYTRHFDEEWRKRNCLGYEVILELHNTSSITEFVRARETFSCRLFPQTQPYLSAISEVLKEKVALLNITSCNDGCHSVTAFYADGLLYIKDTNDDNLRQLSLLSEIPNLKDSLLLESN